jgi:hypothetical protein
MNVGHSNREIDVDRLDRHPHTDLRRHLERYEVNGRHVYLLNRGSLVNLAAGLGAWAHTIRMVKPSSSSAAHPAERERTTSVAIVATPPRRFERGGGARFVKAIFGFTGPEPSRGKLSARACGRA